MTDKNILQRYEERRQRIAEQRMLDEEAAKKKAFAAARQIVRKKAEEKAGGEYEQLGPTQRDTVDKAVADKELVKKVALRLLPKYKTGNRDSSFTHGHKLDNHGQPEGDEHPVQTFKGNVKEDNAMQNFINDKFSQNFKKGEESANAPGGKKDKKSPVVQYSKFGEQMYDALERKAEKTGIDISILGEVFVRGLDAHANATTKLTREQYAFARVNSFISKGKTYYTEDSDLAEEKEEDFKPVSSIEKIAKKHGISVDEMKARLKEGIKVEKEHTKEADVAATIALKHLSEKPDYYSKLKKYVEEVDLEEARAPGRAYVKNYLHPQTGEKIGYKSSTKWGKVKYWRDTESALAKAKQHAGVDKLDESMGNTLITKDKATHQTDTTIWPDSDKPQKLQTLYHRSEGAMKNHIKSLKKKYGAGNVNTKVTKLNEATDTDRVHKIMHKGEHVASIRTYRGRAGGYVSQAEHPDGSDASKKYGIGLMDTKKEMLSKIKKHHAKQIDEATIKSNKDGQSGGRGQTFSSYSPSSYKVLNDKGEHLATAHSAKDPKYGGRTTHWSVTWHKERHKDHPTSFQFMHQLKKHVKELNEDAVMQIDELSKSTLGSYIKKASKEASTARGYEVHARRDKQSDIANQEMKHRMKREKGIDTAVKKLTDEEVEHTNENFIDGKGPGKPGDAARHGLKGKSAAELKKIRSSETASPRTKQLAHWMLNMHHNESVTENLKDPEDNPCWDSYKPVGTKKKNGKTVPNCVPESVQKVEGTNCRNCIHWDDDMVKPVTKEELNPNGGLKAPNKEYVAMTKRVDLGTLPGKDSSVKVKGFCEHKDIMDWVTERMCCSQWDAKGMIRDYTGKSPVMDEETNSEKREKITAVSRQTDPKLRKHVGRIGDTEQKLTRQGEIKNKIIDEEGNSQPDASKRLIGTDSLVKAFKTDTPGETPAKPKKAINESLNESFNIAYAAGIGQTYTAADLGMKMQGAFAHHPDTIKEMEELEAMEEDVVSKTKSPVIIPPIRKADGTYTPAKTVLRTTGRKIIKGDPNVTDGK